METNLLSAIKDALKNHWRAVIGEPEVKAQWMPQEYGVQYWEPSHERSLHLLLEELETVIEKELGKRDEEIERLEKSTASSDDLKAAKEELKQRNIEIEALEATKGRLELQIEELTANNTFLTRHNEELQGRLNDALEAMGMDVVKVIPADGPYTVQFDLATGPDVHKEVLVQAPAVDNPNAILIGVLSDGTEFGIDPNGGERYVKQAAETLGSEINGVTPPKSGATKSTWDAADAILATGIKPTRAQVVEAAAASGVKEATAAAAYSQWCRYHSINSKNPELPFELKERRKGEKGKREEEDNSQIIEAESPVPALVLPPPPPTFLPPPPPPF